MFSLVSKIAVRWFLFNNCEYHLFTCNFKWWGDTQKIMRKILVLLRDFLQIPIDCSPVAGIENPLGQHVVPSKIFKIPRGSGEFG